MWPIKQGLAEIPWKIEKAKIVYSMLLTKQPNGFETPISLFQTARNVVCPSVMLWTQWYIPPPVWIEKKTNQYIILSKPYILSKVGVGDLWCHLLVEPATYLCLSEASTWITNAICRGLFRVQWLEKWKKWLLILVCQWLVAGRWFSPGTPVSSTNKTDRHNITEILLKVAYQTPKP